MKIAIFSDTHLGFGRGTERRGDAELAFEEVVERILKDGADAVLFAGDMFNTSMPSSDTFIFALRTLSKFSKSQGGAKVIEKEVHGIPLIAIHGNHERRSKFFRNPVEAMSDVGFLVHLHLDGVTLEKDGEKVFVQGMSYVPERFAKDILLKWNPRPKNGMKNILLLHQSIDRFIYSPLEPPTINLEELPKGFDLIIDGHIHKREEVNLGRTKFIICGSTVATQTKDEGAKGYYILDTKTMNLEFKEIENQRKIFVFDIKENHMNEMKRILDEILSENYKMKPVVRFRLKNEASINERELDPYRDRVIISMSREVKRMTLEERQIEEGMTAEELGRELLKKNVGEFSEFLSDVILDEDAFEKIYKRIGEEIDKEN